MEALEMSPASDWYAVQVWAGREQSCATHLRSRGLEVFLPLYRERRRWSDRVKQVERALFGGYLFCQLGARGLWQAVQSPGVVRVVGDGRRPLPLALADVVAVQRIVSSGVAAEPWAFLQTGQRVRVEVGPLRGTEGIVLCVRGLRRLVVSVALLQRAVAVELNADWVTAA
jgi:transcription antitermination factor NusG